MAAGDPVFESLQCFQSMMESFGESLSKLCKGNRSESALDLWKNLMEYYQGLHKALQSRYETIETEEKKPDYEALKIIEIKPEEPGSRLKNKENTTSKATVSSPATSSFTEVLSSVKVRPELEALCHKADGCSLINYIVDNREDVETLRNELPVALNKAPDAAKLVLNALEGYDFSRGGSDRKGKKKLESLCTAKKRACILLLESLFPVFGNDESGVVPSDVKDSAREIAKVWRKEMQLEKNAGSADPFNIQAFLQLLATFRLAADYEKDKLWRLVRIILNLESTAELCRSLGLSSDVPALVHKHFNNTPVMALRYAHVCGVMDKVDPVGLLTSYLRRAEERAKVVLTNGHGSADFQTRSSIEMVPLRNAVMLIKEYGLQSHFCEDDLQNKLRIFAQEKEDLKKKRKQEREKAQQKAAEKKAQEKEDTEKAAEKKSQEKEDTEKAVEKNAQEKEDMEKAAERKAQEKKDTDKAGEKKAQEEADRKKAAEKKAKEEKDRKKAAEKKAQVKEDKEKAAEKKAQEKEDKEKAAEKKTQETEDRKRAAEKKAHETEDGKKAAEKMLQHKRHQSSQPGNGHSERENYASKRAKHALPNMTTRVAGGMGNLKASRYNIDEVQKKSGIIGHDHHTSAFSAANGSSIGLATGAFTSAPSIAAQINDERRCHPTAFRTSNLIPIGSSLYGSSAPAGAFAVPLYNVAEINYEHRGQQSYTMNPGEVDKNHARALVGGTGDLAKLSATQSNYNYEGRGQQSNPVSTSAYVTGVLAKSSVTQSRERRVPEMYTPVFASGNMGSIGSSLYGSNSRTIPSSDVNQGGHERSLGQYSGFAGRNMVPFESSGYGPGVSTVPPSSVTQSSAESRRSAIDKYRFNNGLTSLPSAY